MTIVINGNGTFSGLTSVQIAGPISSTTTGDISPIVFRNRIHNGNFVINQRRLSGTVTLSAGVFGHDRYKAGASGCTYTFATSGIDTVITISAGSLIQTIESINIEGGTYVMSWFGTSTGKIGAGSFSTSGITAIGVAANTDLAIEFGTGTLSQIQLELGTVATPFERRPSQWELALCQRYLYTQVCSSSLEDFVGTGGTNGSTGGTLAFKFPVEMRVAPTGLAFVGSASYSSFGLTTPLVASTVTAMALGGVGKNSGRISVTGTGTPYTAGQSLLFYGTISGHGYAWTGAEL